MTRRVVYAPHAQDDLTELSVWIAQESGFPSRGDDFVFAILNFCDGLAQAPSLGQARGDRRPGLRTIGFRRRVVIAFAVDADGVQILGVYYGGRDYERLLASD